jgi:hypothetical protein
MTALEASNHSGPAFHEVQLARVGRHIEMQFGEKRSTFRYRKLSVSDARVLAYALLLAAERLEADLAST